KDLWEASLIDATRVAGTEQEWEKFVGKINHKRNSGNSFRFRFELKWKQVLQAAAVLLVGILLGTGIAHHAGSGTPILTASAPLGSVSKIILPDKTEVFLNAGSQIQYAFDEDGESRGVILDGEAWFKVFKNDRLPFLVQTAYYDIKVLGTEFNVKAYSEDNQIETTLEKGVVQVISSGTLKLKREVSLKPGEQLVYARDKETIRVRLVNPKLYTSWKDNKLEFIKMELGELITLLERKYGVNIEVEDKSILQYHYSGTIKNETILEILEIIRHTLPLRYEIVGQTVKIYKK
ncbi:MAG: FecR domain-containing protein, partial [Prolixibacteraceae bacterium]